MSRCDNGSGVDGWIAAIWVTKGLYLIMLNFLSLMLNFCSGAGLTSAQNSSKAAGACTPETCPGTTLG